MYAFASQRVSAQDEVDDLMFKYQPMFIYNDQSLMNTLFYHVFVTFMPCAGKYSDFLDAQTYETKCVSPQTLTATWSLLNLAHI